MELWMELQWHLRWQLRPPFGTEPKQPNPSRIQAQPVQKPAPEKVPNVAFGRPNNASQGAAKPGQKYGNFSGSLGLGRIEFKGPQSALRHACETATPQQDSNVVF